MAETYNFSDDFQDLIIACTLAFPDQFSISSELILPNYFSSVTAATTILYLKEYTAKYSQWPSFTVFANWCHDREIRTNPDRARELFEYIARLAELDKSDKDSVFDLVATFAKERALLRAVQITHRSIVENKDVKGGIVAMFEQALAIGSETDDMGILLNEDYKEVLAEYGKGDSGIRTGFAPLDDLWRNGWAAGWLIVPLAPPKRYKTTWAINLALNMVHENICGDVIYYACEISQQLASVRALCAITGNTIDDLLDKREVFIANAEHQMPYYSGKFLLKSYASKSTPISAIKAHAKRAIKRYGLKPRAIFIDYAETVRPESAKDTPEYRQQSDIYTQARAMGHDLKCCIIMPDRCTIDFVDRPVPNMKAFQGAFEKAGIVDAGIGLCQTDAEKQQGTMRYFVFLNRHGPEGKLYQGTVEPERYRMTVDREIPYNPDDADIPGDNGRGGSSKHGGRHGGGGHGVANRATDRATNMEP